MKAVCSGSTLWASRLTRGAVEATSAAAEVVRNEYRLTFEDFGCRLVGVRPNLLFAEFPTRGRQHWLASRLGRDHGDGYLVVNLSGRTYDTAKLQGPVMDVVMSGGVPPLDVLMRLCVSAHRWLSSEPQHVIVAHGADGNAVPGTAGAVGPVAVVFSCYLSWAGQVANPKEGVLDFCRAAGVSEEVLWPSHRRYVKYFELLQHGLMDTVGRPQMVLTRVVLVGISGDGVHRTLEIWQQEQLLYRADVDAPEVEGAVFLAGVRCGGDIAVRVLHRGAAASRPAPELELQVCFHTAFVTDGFARFPAHELDAPSGTVPAAGAIDLFFEALPEAAEVAQEDQREATTAAATAAAAAMEGPKPRPAASSDDQDPCFAQVAAGVEDSPEGEPGWVDVHEAGAHAGKVVFLPEDIDSFFDDL